MQTEHVDIADIKEGDRIIVKGKPVEVTMLIQELSAYTPDNPVRHVLAINVWVARKGFGRHRSIRIEYPQRVERVK